MTSNETRDAFWVWFVKYYDEHRPDFSTTPRKKQMRDSWNAALSSGDLVPRKDVEKIVEALKDISFLTACRASKALATRALANFEKH